jgi:hypothetical protein
MAFQGLLNLCLANHLIVIRRHNGAHRLIAVRDDDSARPDLPQQLGKFLHCLVCGHSLRGNGVLRPLPRFGWGSGRRRS